MLGKRSREEDASTEEQNKKKREDEAAAFKALEDRVNFYLTQRKLSMSNWKDERTDNYFLTESERQKEKDLAGAPSLSDAKINSDHVTRRIGAGKWTYVGNEGSDKFSVMVHENDSMKPSRLPSSDKEFNEMWGRVLDLKITGHGATSVTLNFDSPDHPWTKKRVEMFLALAEERGVGVHFGNSMEKFLEKIRENDTASIGKKILTAVGGNETGYEALMQRQRATVLNASWANALKVEPFKERTEKIDAGAKEWNENDFQTKNKEGEDIPLDPSAILNVCEKNIADVEHRLKQGIDHLDLLKKKIDDLQDAANLDAVKDDPEKLEALQKYMVKYEVDFKALHSIIEKDSNRCKVIIENSIEKASLVGDDEPKKTEVLDKLENIKKDEKFNLLGEKRMDIEKQIKELKVDLDAKLKTVKDAQPAKKPS